MLSRYGLFGCGDIPSKDDGYFCEPWDTEKYITLALVGLWAITPIFWLCTSLVFEAIRHHRDQQANQDYKQPIRRILPYGLTMGTDN